MMKMNKKIKKKNQAKWKKSKNHKKKIKEKI